jgi:hypothetical protein
MLDDRLQILLDVFSAESVLLISLKRAHLVGNLLCQHLDEAQSGGALQGISAPTVFARVYRVPAILSAELQTAVGVDMGLDMKLSQESHALFGRTATTLQILNDVAYINSPLRDASDNPANNA